MSVTLCERATEMRTHAVNTPIALNGRLMGARPSCRVVLTARRTAGRQIRHRVYCRRCRRRHLHHWPCNTNHRHDGLHAHARAGSTPMIVFDNIAHCLDPQQLHQTRIPRRAGRYTYCASVVCVCACVVRVWVDALVSLSETNCLCKHQLLGQ